MWNENQLMAKKKEIEKAKQTVSELRGEEKALLKQLKDLGCDNLVEARGELELLQKKMDALTEKITISTEAFEKNYPQ
jgi:signal transduction histidine kinase